MTFQQKLGLFCLILISIVYIYFSFFNKDSFHFNISRDLPQIEIQEPTSSVNEQNEIEIKQENKKIKIFISDSNGKIRSVIRECDTSSEKSCFAYAINQLIAGPTKWERSKGFTSDIPQGTKVLSIREGENSIMIDFSSSFEGGGGAESIYNRVMQVIKTANANTNLPVYLYINGKQADVIGGEGIMVKQPLNERSLDE